MQFGAALAGRSYPDRAAAFGVAEREDGWVAVVHVIRPEGAYFDLPGGALEAGEDEALALVREFAEETGLIVRPGPLLTRSSQYLVMAGGVGANNRAGHFRVAVEGLDPARKIERDHHLVWLAPTDALARVRHESHAWALAAFLRGVGASGLR